MRGGRQIKSAVLIEEFDLYTRSSVEVKMKKKTGGRRTSVEVTRSQVDGGGHTEGEETKIGSIGIPTKEVRNLTLFAEVADCRTTVRNGHSGQG